LRPSDFVSGLMAVEDITAAVQAGDCAALTKLMANTAEFIEVLRHMRPHPIIYAATPQIAKLLIPFARRRHLLETINDALMFETQRAEVATTIIEHGRSRLGTAVTDGHVWLNQWRGGTSALHVVATFNCIGALPYLLTLRPNLEAQGHHASPALGLAVQQRNVEVVKALLAAGANPDSGIPRLVDCDPVRTTIIARLLVDAGARTTQNVGLLLSMLPRDDWQRIIAQASPVSTWPHKQVTLAFEAVDIRHAKELMAAGADPRAATIGAVRNTNAAVLRVVAGSLCNLNPGGFEALMLRPKDLLDALADGLAVNARDDTGRTLLTLAARQLAYTRFDFRTRLRHSIVILLEAGADRTGRVGTSSPLRAFLSIAGGNQANELRWLLLRGLRDRLVLHYYLRPGACAHPELLGVLLQFGLAPNVQDAFGRTPLHLLVANKEAEDARKNLQLLLYAGADTTIKDKQGETPLDAALRFKHDAVIEGLQMDRRRQGAWAMRESLVSHRVTRTPPRRMRL
jgi:ankyrin repeat protein